MAAKHRVSLHHPSAPLSPPSQRAQDTPHHAESLLATAAMRPMKREPLHRGAEEARAILSP